MCCFITTYLLLFSNPENNIAHDNWGQLCESHGRSETAKDHYLSAIRVNERDVSAHLHLALLCHIKLKDNSLALYHYRRAIDLDPTDDFAHTNIARLLLEYDSTDESLTHFLLACEYNDRNIDAFYQVECDIVWIYISLNYIV